MHARIQGKRRNGAMIVEAAIVLPVLFLMLFGIVVGGMGVFRHQLVACQAREAARYASVRGADWEYAIDQTPLKCDKILTDAVLPLATTMDPNRLKVTVEWVNRATNDVEDWDASPRHVRSLTAAGEYVTNSVRVTVSYHWIPECYLGAMEIKSVSEIPMSN